MDADDILARQVEQLDKEKKELQIRLKTQEKKVKHTLSCHPSKESQWLQLPPPKNTLPHPPKKTSWHLHFVTGVICQIAQKNWNYMLQWLLSRV